MTNDLPGPLTLKLESPITGEKTGKAEVEGVTDATAMAWWPHNIRSILLSSCCVRSSVARPAECSSMPALRSEISASIRTSITWMCSSMAAMRAWIALSCVFEANVGGVANEG